MSLEKDAFSILWLTWDKGKILSPHEKPNLGILTFCFLAYLYRLRIYNSLYCQPYNSYKVSSENLVVDQLLIPKLIFVFILITFLVDIVRRNSVLVTHRGLTLDTLWRTGHNEKRENYEALTCFFVEAGGVKFIFEKL